MRYIILFFLLFLFSCKSVDKTIYKDHQKENNYKIDIDSSKLLNTITSDFNLKKIEVITDSFDKYDSSGYVLFKPKKVTTKYIDINNTINELKQINNNVINKEDYNKTINIENKEVIKKPIKFNIFIIYIILIAALYFLIKFFLNKYKL